MNILRLVFYPTLSQFQIELELPDSIITNLLNNMSDEYKTPIEYFEYQAYLTIISNSLRLEHIRTIDPNKQKLVISFKEKKSVHLRKPCNMQLDEIFTVLLKFIDNFELKLKNGFYSVLWSTNFQEKSSLLFFYKLELTSIECSISSNYMTPKFIGLLPVKFNEKYWNFSSSVCKFNFNFNFI